MPNRVVVGGDNDVIAVYTLCHLLGIFKVIDAPLCVSNIYIRLSLQTNARESDFKNW
jgi:hypothetical protein